MRNDGWLQKLLYGIMFILGVYILYKAGGLLSQSFGVQRLLDSGNVQKALEDAAMRTYAPGYTATVEEREGENWFAGWMSQIVPVYSYLADNHSRQESWQTEMPENNTSGEEGGLVGETDQPGGENQIDGIVRMARGKQTDETAQISGEKQTDGTVQTAGEIQTDGTVQTAGEIQTDGTVQTTEEKQTDEIWADMEELGQAVTGTEEMDEETDVQAAATLPGSELLRSQLRDFSYLLNTYFTVDSGTTAGEELLNADILLDEDLSIEKNPDMPQILIYHTHSQEGFVDSKEGAVEDTITGMGEVLAEHLRSCGYNVIHDTGVYDLVNGVLDRSAAYDYAREAIQKILEENPNIEVIIDLHRDGVDGKKFVTEIGGKPCSMIMFFNGISRNEKNEPLYWLENPYVSQNLAFSLQLQIKAQEQYPGLTRKIYLKAERFNLHLRPRSLLIEAGTQLNTVEEEKNAMELLADLICQVLGGT